MGNKSSSASNYPDDDVFADDQEEKLPRTTHIDTDRTFQAELHSSSGKLFSDKFGETSFVVGRSVQIICRRNVFEIVEEFGISSRRFVEVRYLELTGVTWDHASSSVKLDVTYIGAYCFVILVLSLSIDFENELKIRIQNSVATRRGMKMPPTTYVGIFAGMTKPKPFQRKRPNLTALPLGKLPPLLEMRSHALKLHRGSYHPCPPGESRRMALAVQHVFEGFNSFKVLAVTGGIIQWTNQAVLQIKDRALVYKYQQEIEPVIGATETEFERPDDLLDWTHGRSDNCFEFPFGDIINWNAVDNDTASGAFGHGGSVSGLEVALKDGRSLYFAVHFIRDVKHTMEFFWNRYQVANGGSVKAGSTHGRPIVSLTTLSGEVPSLAAPQGLTDVVDMDGVVVTPGTRMLPRKSMAAGIMSSIERKMVPPENPTVKKHWHKVVTHQGWLTKKGGVGYGNKKSWIKRYFVLYSTSQGHFLAYYSDFTECPLFTDERSHRNVIDIAKTTFLRAGSRKADQTTNIPPFSFDIVTIEREWTLCAENQEEQQKWLQLLTRAVDEDVAILPDEELVFNVKTKIDPLESLPFSDYSTTIRVSSFGVSVCAPDLVDVLSGSFTKADASHDREHHFWVFTDFYKWYLLLQQGKLAILLEVFADSSYGRRHEYVFRTKEASRLATSIEFYIEKFMSVMMVLSETVFRDSMQHILGDKFKLTSGSDDGGEMKVEDSSQARVAMNASTSALQLDMEDFDWPEGPQDDHFEGSMEEITGAIHRFHHAHHHEPSSDSERVLGAAGGFRPRELSINTDDDEGGATSPHGLPQPAPGIPAKLSGRTTSNDGGGYTRGAIALSSPLATLNTSTMPPGTPHQAVRHIYNETTGVEEPDNTYSL